MEDNNITVTWPARDNLMPVVTEEENESGETNNINRQFLTANSMSVTLDSLKNDCVIPTFSKDNEAVVSHTQFIEAVYTAMKDYFPTETVNQPSIRVSHIIRGRIPEAINKKASDLLPYEKTQYYERMACVINVPTLMENVNGNPVNLSVCMVKAYNHDNLNGRLIPQKFSIAVGFQNQVCTNQCIFTDGTIEDFKAIDMNGIYRQTLDVLSKFDSTRQLYLLKSLGDVYLEESQFAQILGRMRMYNYLPNREKRTLPAINITDSACNAVAKTYFNDNNFKADENGIDMWRFYNLLTGATKNSYIDTFLPRLTSATETSLGIASALRHENSGYEWFLK